MLPVAVPAHVVKQHRKAQRQLRVKDLIGTDGSECFLPATDGEYSRTPGENAAHARNGAAIAQKRNQGVWRLDHLSGFHAARMPDPVAGIVSHATPAVPVLGGSVEDLRIADVVQNGYLLRQFVRQVHVVGIEKGQILAGGMMDTEVS